MTEADLFTDLVHWHQVNRDIDGTPFRASFRGFLAWPSSYQLTGRWVVEYRNPKMNDTAPKWDAYVMLTHEELIAASTVSHAYTQIVAKTTAVRDRLIRDVQATYL